MNISNCWFGGQSALVGETLRPARSLDFFEKLFHALCGAPSGGLSSELHVPQHRLKSVTSSIDPGLDRLCGHAEPLCRLGMRKPLHRGQDQRRLQIVRQSINGSLEDSQPLIPLDSLVWLQIPGTRLRQIVGRSCRERQRTVRVAICTAAHPIPTKIGRYGEKPGCEPCSGLERADSKIGPHECFLSQVRGIGLVPQVAANERKDCRLVPEHQFIESGVIAGLQSPDELEIRIGHTLNGCRPSPTEAPPP